MADTPEVPKHIRLDIFNRLNVIKAGTAPAVAAKLGHDDLLVEYTSVDDKIHHRMFKAHVEGDKLVLTDTVKRDGTFTKLDEDITLPKPAETSPFIAGKAVHSVRIPLTEEQEVALTPKLEAALGRKAEASGPAATPPATQTPAQPSVVSEPKPEPIHLEVFTKENVIKSHARPKMLGNIAADDLVVKYLSPEDKTNPLFKAHAEGDTLVITDRFAPDGGLIPLKEPFTIPKPVLQAHSDNPSPRYSDVPMTPELEAEVKPKFQAGLKNAPAPAAPAPSQPAAENATKPEPKTGHIQLIVFNKATASAMNTQGLADQLKNNEQLVEYVAGPGAKPSFFKGHVEGDKLVLTDQLTIQAPPKSGVVDNKLDNPMELPNPKVNPNDPPLRHSRVILTDAQEADVRTKLDTEVSKHAASPHAFNDHVKNQVAMATSGMARMDVAHAGDLPNGPTAGGPANVRSTGRDGLPT